MCELVALRGPTESTIRLMPGDEIRVGKGADLASFDLDGLALQCWHPEAPEWSTMLPPVAGMAWHITPGSKIRAVPKEDAGLPAPLMAEQVAAFAGKEA